MMVMGIPEKCRCWKDKQERDWDYDYESDGQKEGDAGLDDKEIKDLNKVTERIRQPRML